MTNLFIRFSRSFTASVTATAAALCAAKNDPCSCTNNDSAFWYLQAIEATDASFQHRVLEGASDIDQLHQIYDHVSPDPNDPTPTLAQSNYEFQQQCLLYESANVNARLNGIEFIISKRLYDQLSEREQYDWHSHFYNCIDGGFSTCPGIEDADKNHAFGRNLWKTCLI